MYLQPCSEEDMSETFGPKGSKHCLDGAGVDVVLHVATCILVSVGCTSDGTPGLSAATVF